MARTKLKSKKSNPAEANSDKKVLSVKEKLIQERKARETRQKMVKLIMISLMIGSCFGIPLALLVDLKIGLGLIVAFIAILFSYQYPRQALWFFLIYMPLSGTVTYWIGGGNALFQLSKDAFYIFALIALIRDCQRQKKPILVKKNLIPTFTILIVLALAVLFFVNGTQEFLPYCDDLPNKWLRDAAGNYILNEKTGLVIPVPCKGTSPFLQGLLGFKVIVGYIPLIFCSYYLIEDKKQVIFLGRLLLVLTIICCVLGLAQYWMLSSGRCIGTRGAVGQDLFEPSLQAKCFVGGSLLFSPSQGVIRLPGTFVSPWHWAWFLIANSAITFATAFSDPSRLWKLGGLGGMTLVFMNAVISGQRIALALVPAFIIIMVVLSGQIVNLKRFIPIAVVFSVIIAGVVVSNPAIVQERVDSFVERWNASPPHLFIASQWEWALSNSQGPLGEGLGKATNSTRIFGDVTLVETYHPKLHFEIGILGLLGYMIFLTHLTIVSYKDYRKIQDKTLRNYASSFWVFILLISYFPYWYPLDTDPVAVYYWFFAGVIFKMAIIDKQEQDQTKYLAREKGEQKGKQRIGRQKSRRRKVV